MIIVNCHCYTEKILIGEVILSEKSTKDFVLSSSTEDFNKTNDLVLEFRKIKKRSAISRILSRPVIYLRFTLLQNFCCLPLINARAELN